MPRLFTPLALSLVLAPWAFAADQGLTHKERSGSLGVGLVIPSPAGLSGKYFLSPTTALDVTLGSMAGAHGGTTLQASYLYHFQDVILIAKGSLPLYVGLGGRLVVLDDDGHGHDGDLGSALRLPLGLAWWTPDQPLEFFGELVPTIEFSPHADFAIDLSLGARYYF